MCIDLARARETASPSQRSAMTLRIGFLATLAFAGTALAMLGAATAADAQVLRPFAGHLSQVPSAAQTAAPPARQTPAPPATNGYVGESTCVACHDQKYSGTAHGLKSNER